MTGVENGYPGTTHDLAALALNISAWTGLR